MGKIVEHAQIAQNDRADAAQQLDASVSAPERLITVEQLAHGSEGVGGKLLRSVQVRKVLKMISRLSRYKATVLIHGDFGTGKQLVARALHALGPVPGGPFVTFLLESGRVAREVAALRSRQGCSYGTPAIFVSSGDRQTVARIVEAPAAFRASAPKPLVHRATSPFLLDQVIRNKLLRSLEETDGNPRRARFARRVALDVVPHADALRPGQLSEPEGGQRSASGGG